MRLNGCHNRKPYANGYGKWGLDPQTGKPRFYVVENVMSRDCVYTTSELGQQDKGCTGCKWRKDE